MRQGLIFLELSQPLAFGRQGGLAPLDCNNQWLSVGERPAQTVVRLVGGWWGAAVHTVSMALPAMPCSMSMKARAAGATGSPRRVIRP